MKILLKILIHTIFWFVFVLVNYAFQLSTLNSDLPAISNLTPHYIINFSWAALAFYFFYFYAIKYFEKRRLLAYLGISVAASIILTVISMILHKLIMPEFNLYNLSFIYQPILGTFIIEQCGSLVRGFESWFTNMQLKVELENLNLKNELQLLKAQINPHFLFNTLNNIDSLIYKAPAEASKSLITLSDMLRYMIYDTKNDLVRLDKEIAYIQSYIELQKIRFKKAEYVSFTYNEQCKNVLIAPVIFIVFIENAFKYSFNNGNFPVIDIKLSTSENELRFYCSNYYNKEGNEQKRPGGVGLENVKRRLQILYPEKHILKISNDKNIFTVDLKIDLA